MHREIFSKLCRAMIYFDIDTDEYEVFIYDAKKKRSTDKIIKHVVRFGGEFSIRGGKSAFFPPNTFSPIFS